MVYFAKGCLPWQGLKGDKKEERYDRVCEMKKSTSIETLCRNLPVEFMQLLHYARAIKFEDTPDYMRLKKLFKDLFLKKGMDYDFEYDWNSLYEDVRNINYVYRLIEDDERNGTRNAYASGAPKNAEGTNNTPGADSPIRKNTTQSVEGLMKMTSLKSDRKQNKDLISPVSLFKKNTVNVRAQNTFNFDNSPKKKSYEEKKKPSCDFSDNEINEGDGIFYNKIPKRGPNSVRKSCADFNNDS